jgi:uncharacterized protein
MSTRPEPARAGVFLTAEWRHLVMLNYPVEPASLAPMVPRGTELDEWQGITCVSMVGFLFHETRVLGIAIPFHRHFEEVNLRFYVRRKGPEGWRRGVVFVREIVPRAAIALVARVVYNENYIALPMRHRVDLAGDGRVEYAWRHAGQWSRLGANVRGEPAPMAAGSEEEFIAEHYWGYARQRGGGTVEYAVEHPRWNVWRAEAPELSADVVGLYGPVLGEALSGPPRSAFVADGSPVVVRRGVGI